MSNTETKSHDLSKTKNRYSLRLRDRLSPEATELYDNILKLHPDERGPFSLSNRCRGELPFRYLVRSVIEGTTNSKEWSKRLISDEEIAENINDEDVLMGAHVLLIDKSKDNWEKRRAQAKKNNQENWRIIRGALAFTAGVVIFFFA